MTRMVEIIEAAIPALAQADADALQALVGVAGGVEGPAPSETAMTRQRLRALELLMEGTTRNLRLLRSLGPGGAGAIDARS